MSSMAAQLYHNPMEQIKYCWRIVESIEAGNQEQYYFFNIIANLFPVF